MLVGHPDNVRNRTAKQDESPTKKKRRRRLPRYGFDRRTRHGLVVRRLVEMYRESLGSSADDPVMAERVQRTAELVAYARHLRQEALDGNENICPDDVV